MPSRFLTLADVTEVLNISAPQAYALVRSGELPAIQIGGRLQWRVESTELEKYIQRMYEQTRARISSDGSTVDGAHVRLRPSAATARPASVANATAHGPRARRVTDVAEVQVVGADAIHPADQLGPADVDPDHRAVARQGAQGVSEPEP